jgi:hypothetical protein
MGALRRDEFFRVIEVPADLSDEDVLEFLNGFLDGSEYEEDADFWERGDEYAEKPEEGDKPTCRIVVEDGALTDLVDIPDESVTATAGVMSSAEYMKRGGGGCPACGDELNVEGIGNNDFCGSEFTNTIRCLVCGASWTDVYTHTSYDNLCDSDDKPITIPPDEEPLAKEPECGECGTALTGDGLCPDEDCVAEPPLGHGKIHATMAEQQQQEADYIFGHGYPGHLDWAAFPLKEEADAWEVSGRTFRRTVYLEYAAEHDGDLSNRPMRLTIVFDEDSTDVESVELKGKL